MEKLAQRPSRREELLSTDAVRLSVKATGGPVLWFLWSAGSGQELVPPLPGPDLREGWISISLPGRTIEQDARLGGETAELWKSIQKPKRRRTPLGRRLAELRERILASGEPLLSSWEEVDRELGERRGELREEDG